MHYPRGKGPEKVMEANIRQENHCREKKKKD
jgi:hypothetical protein